MWPPSKHAQQVLDDWQMGHAALHPIHMGHINETYVVQDGADRYVLQRLNPIFRAEIHLDIDRITKHLAAQGMITPHLLPTRANTLWTHDVDQGVWRLQTYMPGDVFNQTADAAMCRAAGYHLGRFHRALSTLQHTFATPRLGVHDTSRHLAGLSEALVAHRQHVAYPQVAPLAEALLEAAAKLPAIQQLAPRVVHGDPKISNFVFGPDGAAACLIDLDTVGTMAVPLELGDAFRSWCNPNGEGQEVSRFRLDWFAAGLAGYAAGAAKLLTTDEVALLPDAVGIISVELAARFLRDTLEERYFGWDASRYAAAWEHNLVRARSQWTLAQAYGEVRGAAADIVWECFTEAV